jgi:hypothetical protein
MPDKPLTRPIAVGGLGGSGTRLIAQMLSELGVFMGSDLNASKDNLWFTLLFKRIEILDCPDEEFRTCVRLFAKRMQGPFELRPTEQRLLGKLARVGRPQHATGWLEERIASFIAADRDIRPSTVWGWKEPNTHIVIDRLLEAMPSLRYVHVIRNGLDMAYSLNQNQVLLWGKPLFGLPEAGVDPGLSLVFWCRSHERLLAIRAAWPGRVLFVNYDSLCLEPETHIRSLLSFVDRAPTPTIVADLARLVRPPDSIGRFRSHNRDRFKARDLDLVTSLGFPVE